MVMVFSSIKRLSPSIYLKNENHTCSSEKNQDISFVTFPSHRPDTDSYSILLILESCLFMNIMFLHKPVPSFRNKDLKSGSIPILSGLGQCKSGNL